MHGNIPHRRWIAICADLIDHPVVGANKRRRGGFTKLEAWLWLIAHAAFKTHPVGTMGKTITLARGQLPVGRDFLAKSWGWGQQRVRTFLIQLAAENMVEINQLSRRLPSVLSICNYEKFQSSYDDSNQVSNHLGNQPITNSQPHNTKDTKDTSKNPPVVPQKPKRNSKAQQEALRFLNPAAAEVHDDVSWDQDARIQTFNGFRVELLDQLRGDEKRLRRELDVAAKYISTHVIGIDLKKAVRAQLAKQEGFRAERQEERESVRPKKSQAAYVGPTCAELWAQSEEMDRQGGRR